MPRYFIEVCYKGTAYSGFQIQQNAISIQSEVEHALSLVLRSKISLTGSSRTDAGVHALQNYFHFDFHSFVPASIIYSLNSILRKDIAVLSVRQVLEESHARFNAISRSYVYHLHAVKNPFLEDRSWYYPYPLNFTDLKQVANIVKETKDFTAFSKLNTQVKTNICSIQDSYWVITDSGFEYTVRGNRFLRGMVRGLVGTMLMVGKGKITIDDFCRIIEMKDHSKADFSTPAHGLFLKAVDYPPDQFI
jgi:tRNA pseudouridine38-40 synthase